MTTCNDHTWKLCDWVRRFLTAHQHN